MKYTLGTTVLVLLLILTVVAIERIDNRPQGDDVQSNLKYSLPLNATTYED